MSLTAPCKTCGVTLRVPDKFGGNHIRCPRCQMGVLVPGGRRPDIAAACKSCGASWKATEQEAGQHVRCPRCNMGVLVPRAKPARPWEPPEDSEVVDFDPESAGAQQRDEIDHDLEIIESDGSIHVFSEPAPRTPAPVATQRAVDTVRAEPRLPNQPQAPGKKIDRDLSVIKADRSAPVSEPAKPVPAPAAAQRTVAPKRPVVTVNELDGLDLDLEIIESDDEIPQTSVARAPAQPRRKGTAPVSGKRNSGGIDRNLEIIESDDELPRLPTRIVRKPDPVEVEKPKKAKFRTKHRDAMVWVLLIALLPLAIQVCLPHVPWKVHYREIVQQHPELAEEYEEGEEPASVQEFRLLNPDIPIPGAHLPRETMVHWLYAGLAALAYLTLFATMRSKTKVSAPWLLFTGVATGTLGIAMLLIFQFIAVYVSYTSVIGGGAGALILIILRWIGFSYRCAMDPNNGFLLSFFGFTCGVGLCEEVCKCIPVYMYLRANPKADWRGTCLLGMASGAGFGISEGIMYSADYYNGTAPGFIYLVRFASCVALHAMWSGTVALLMFGNQDYIDGGDDWQTFFWGLLQYVFIAMVLHGLYDTMLKQNLTILALATALASFGWMAWLSKYYWSYRPSPA